MEEKAEEPFVKAMGALIQRLAGALGFEPRNDGIKNR